MPSLCASNDVKGNVAKRMSQNLFYRIQDTPVRIYIVTKGNARNVLLCVLILSTVIGRNSLYNWLKPHAEDAFMKSLKACRDSGENLLRGPERPLLEIARRRFSRTANECTHPTMDCTRENLQAFSCRSHRREAAVANVELSAATWTNIQTRSIISQSCGSQVKSLSLTAIWRLCRLGQQKVRSEICAGSRFGNLWRGCRDRLVRVTD